MQTSGPSRFFPPASRTSFAIRSTSSHVSAQNAIRVPLGRWFLSSVKPKIPAADRYLQHRTYENRRRDFRERIQPEAEIFRRTFWQLPCLSPVNRCDQNTAFSSSQFESHWLTIQFCVICKDRARSPLPRLTRFTARMEWRTLPNCNLTNYKPRQNRS